MLSKRIHGVSLAQFRLFNAAALLLLAGVLSVGSCKGRAGGEAESAKTAIRESSGEALERAPTVEAQLVLPAVERGKAGLLIAYRDTRFGFADSEGFDTLIYRVSLSPNGWLDGASVYERRIDGEKGRASYTFSYAGESIIVAQTREGASMEIAKVAVIPRKVEVRGTVERIVAREAGGGISFASMSGDYQERFLVPGYRKEGTKLLVSRNGVVEAEGRFDFSKKGRVVFMERNVRDLTGAEETTISLWIDENGDYRFRTEGVAPVNEVYASGLEKALSGDQGFLNLVLLDIVLGRERNIRPILAYALSAQARLSP